MKFSAHKNEGLIVARARFGASGPCVNSHTCLCNAPQSGEAVKHGCCLGTGPLLRGECQIC